MNRKTTYRVKKHASELIPGNLVRCESGRYLAFYEHRTDIIANGENEKDARKNLREMYAIVIKHEIDEAAEKGGFDLSNKFDVISFKEKLPC